MENTFYIPISIYVSIVSLFFDKYIDIKAPTLLPLPSPSHAHIYPQKVTTPKGLQGIVKQSFNWRSGAASNCFNCLL